MADIDTINDLKDDAKLEAIEDRAAMIASQIASATDPSVIRSLGDAAKALMAMIPQGNNRTGTVTGKVAGVISEANSKEAEESEIEGSSGTSAGMGPRSRMSMEFQKAIYNQMSAEEKAYYDQFQSGTQYKMASIDENGNITEKMADGKQATVDGAQLKEDFARVKSYTLTEEQQANITTPDGQKMGLMAPAEEKKELDRLEKSLDNLEGQKAQELSDTGAGKEEAKRVRGAFMKARERVRDLKDGLDDVEKAKRGGRKSEEEYAMGDVKLKKRRLREALQDDVIDDALTGKKRGSRSGRDKEDDLENEMVTPMTTRAGGIRANGSSDKESAEKEILSSQNTLQSGNKPALISTMQDVATGTAVSPSAAGETKQSTLER